MTSPGSIADIEYSRVGSIDSSYYGTTILDSDTSRVSLSNSDVIEQKSFMTTNTHGQSLNGGGDGGGAATTTERWY